MSTKLSFTDIIAKAKERHEAFVAKMDDKNALMYFKIFPEWKADCEYAKGMRVRYNDKLYRVTTDHTSISNETPDVSCEKYNCVTAE